MKKGIYTLLSLCLMIQLHAQNFGLQFDGLDDNLELCSSDDFNIGEGFTIEAWIYASEWRAEAWQGTIVAKDMPGPDSGFAFRAGKNGTLSFVVSAAGQWQEIQSDPFMNANQWYHVAAVKIGDKIQIYVNGGLVGTNSISAEPSPNNVAVKIGSSSGFPGRFWNGFIDEVRIWDVARTQQELSDNQTTAFEGNEPGLVTYLPFNDGSSLSAVNLANPGCAATLINMTEAAWQEGYSIPRNDVGATRLSAPDVISIFTKPVKLQAEIQNFGSEAVSNIPMNVDINGLPAFSQTFNITIEPGEIATVVFDQIVDLTDNNTNLINVSANHPEDANSLNNSVSYRYRKPSDNTTINILNEERYNFGGEGQTKFTDINLPENSEDFEKLLLHISVECPPTGCDPWDQPARISVETDEGAYEIARFITPYGQGCGPWTVDVTDFKSILKGGVTFKSFVQVWGPSGWLVNLDLEYVKGDKPSYNKVTTLWESDNFVYGDPGISYDLPERTITIDEVSQTNHVRMTITGHGQGNTDNAAEFSIKNHSMFANSERIDVQNLWKNDCAQNSCANQAGTWTLSRAGWCPGEAVEPHIVNTTSVASAGENIVLDYELQKYTNLLNTGYNNNGHTEPHYKIFSYFIESSDDRYTSFTNLRADNIAISTNGNTSNPAITGLDFTMTNTGSEDIVNPTVAYYVNDEFVFEETLSQTIMANETYIHAFSQTDGFDLGDDNLVYAVVTAGGDQNISDDATKASINENLVAVADLTASQFSISPNPSSGFINITMSDDFLAGNLQIVDILGKVVLQKEINQLNENIQLQENGVYLMILDSKSGVRKTEKIVIE